MTLLHLWRQADLRDEAKQLRWFMEPVNRAGLGIKLGERVAQGFFKVSGIHNFLVARRKRQNFAAYLQRHEIILTGYTMHDLLNGRDCVCEGQKQNRTDHG
jgi:hypothetical protein